MAAWQQYAWQWPEKKASEGQWYTEPLQAGPPASHVLPPAVPMAVQADVECRRVYGPRIC